MKRIDHAKKAIACDAFARGLGAKKAAELAGLSLCQCYRARKAAGLVHKPWAQLTEKERHTVGGRCRKKAIACEAFCRGVSANEAGEVAGLTRKACYRARKELGLVNGRRAPLTDQQRKACAAFRRGRPAKEAAELAGLTRRQCYRARKALGLVNKPRIPLTEEQRATIVRLRKAGRWLWECAAAAGCSEGEAWQTLKRARLVGPRHRSREPSPAEELRIRQLDAEGNLIMEIARLLRLPIEAVRAVLRRHEGEQLPADVEAAIAEAAATRPRRGLAAIFRRKPSYGPAVVDGVGNGAAAGPGS
jgi:hypothetical protein